MSVLFKMTFPFDARADQSRFEVVKLAKEGLKIKDRAIFFAPKDAQGNLTFVCLSVIIIYQEN